MVDSSFWETYMTAAAEATETGNVTDAERLYTFALREAEKLGQRDERYLQTLHRLARIFTQQSKWEQAEQTYTRALALHEEVKPDDIAEFCAMVNEMAMLNRAQGKYAEADAY